MTLAARLPEYPWDELAPIAEKARAFPGGAVDLSIGHAGRPGAPGHPGRARGGRQRARLPADRGDARAALGGRRVARPLSLDVHVDPVSVLPVIGTKEFIAWLPIMLGLGPG